MARLKLSQNELPQHKTQANVLVPVLISIARGVRLVGRPKSLPSGPVQKFPFTNASIFEGNG